MNTLKQIKIYIKNLSKKNAGFTLLFAALVTSLLLSVGLAIFNITLQQFLLASSGRESQFAFYAADSGVECGLYFDKKGIDFVSPQAPFYFPDGDSAHAPGPTITCNGIVSAAPQVLLSSNPYKTKYDINLGSPAACDPTKPSFSIVVTKSIQSSSTATTIESRGYNTCDTTNLRRVERGLKVNY